MKRPMFVGEVVVAVRPRKDCGHWFEHGAVVELTRSGPLGEDDDPGVGQHASTSAQGDRRHTSSDVGNGTWR